MSGYRVIATDYFGPFNRFAMDTVITRFGTYEYVVLDAQQADEYGLRKVVAQGTNAAACRAIALASVPREDWELFYEDWEL